MTEEQQPDSNTIRSLTNRGRWGPDDERGALNFIDDTARRRGVDEAREGRVVAMAYPVTPAPLAAPIPIGPQGPAGISQLMNFMGSPPRVLADTLVINSHHVSLTHIDALAHIPARDNQEVYPGVPISEAVGLFGQMMKGSTTAFIDGIVTRGIFLDLAPGGRLNEDYVVTDHDLDGAAQRGGVTVESGDALVVRGGWAMRTAEDAFSNRPSIGVDAVKWMSDHQISVYAGDICDSSPLGPPRVHAMHHIALAQLGIPLIDNPDVTGLAAACGELGRVSFLFVVAPIAVRGATGLPVNPLAIF
jgi:kynurenine formamidase